VLKIKYERICDACGAQISAESYNIQHRNNVLPQPPSADLNVTGFELCEGCYEPLREPLLEIIVAGATKKGRT